MTINLPLLPLRDIVVFPHMIVPLFVGRDKSVAALEHAMSGEKEIFLVAQLDLDASVLGQALLGDVELRHDLHTAGDGLAQAQRRGREEKVVRQAHRHAPAEVAGQAAQAGHARHGQRVRGPHQYH